MPDVDVGHVNIDIDGSGSGFDQELADAQRAVVNFVNASIPRIQAVGNALIGVTKGPLSGTIGSFEKVGDTMEHTISTLNVSLGIYQKTAAQYSNEVKNVVTWIEAQGGAFSRAALEAQNFDERVVKTMFALGQLQGITDGVSQGMYRLADAEKSVGDLAVETTRSIERQDMATLRLSTTIQQQLAKQDEAVAKNVQVVKDAAATVTQAEATSAAERDRIAGESALKRVQIEEDANLRIRKMQAELATALGRNEGAASVDAAIAANNARAEAARIGAVGQGPAARIDAQRVAADAQFENAKLQAQQERYNKALAAEAKYETASSLKHEQTHNTIAARQRQFDLQQEAEWSINQSRRVKIEEQAGNAEEAITRRTQAKIASINAQAAGQNKQERQIAISQILSLENESQSTIARIREVAQAKIAAGDSKFYQSEFAKRAALTEELAAIEKKAGDELALAHQASYAAITSADTDMYIRQEALLEAHQAKMLALDNRYNAEVAKADAQAARERESMRFGGFQVADAFSATSKYSRQFSLARQAGDHMMMGGALLAAPVVGSVLASNDLNREVLKAKGNAEMSTGEASTVKEQIKDIDSDQPIDKLAQAFMRASNFGYKNAEAMKVVKAANDAAVASFSDVDKTTEALAATMHQFNIGAGDSYKVINAMEIVAAKNNITLEDFVKSAGRGFAAAAAMHVPFTEAAAVMGTLTKNQFTAAQSTTALRSIIKGIEQPSKDSAKWIKYLSDTTGVDLVRAFSASGLSSNGLIGTFDLLQKATHGNVDLLGHLFSDQRSAIPVISLLTNSHKDLMDAVKAENEQIIANNRVQNNAAEVRKSVTYQLGAMKKEVIAVGSEFGDTLAPDIGKATNAIHSFLDWMQSLDPVTKKTTAQVALGGAAFLLTAGATLKLLSSIPGIIEGFKAIEGLLVPLATKLGVAKVATVELGEAETATATEGAIAFGPAGVLMLALAGLAVELNALNNLWDSMRQAQDQARQSAEDYAHTLDRIGKTNGEQGQLVKNRAQIVEAKSVIDSQLANRRKIEARQAALRAKGDTIGADNLRAEEYTNPKDPGAQTMTVGDRTVSKYGDPLTTTAQMEAWSKQYAIDIKKETDRLTQISQNNRAGTGMQDGKASPGIEKYDAIIQRVAREQGVSPNVIKAIINNETGGNPTAINHNKNGTTDYGIMQVNSATKNPNSYNWKDPYQNMVAGVEEFKNKLKQAGGDLREGFRRYNGRGPAAERYADKAMAYYQSLSSMKTGGDATTKGGNDLPDWAKPGQHPLAPGLSTLPMPVKVKGGFAVPSLGRTLKDAPGYKLPDIYGLGAEPVDSKKIMSQTVSATNYLAIEKQIQIIGDRQLEGLGDQAKQIDVINTKLATAAKLKDLYSKAIEVTGGDRALQGQAANIKNISNNLNTTTVPQLAALKAQITTLEDARFKQELKQRQSGQKPSEAYKKDISEQSLKINELLKQYDALHATYETTMKSLDQLSAHYKKSFDESNRLTTQLTKEQAVILNLDRDKQGLLQATPSGQLQAIKQNNKAGLYTHDRYVSRLQGLMGSIATSGGMDSEDVEGADPAAVLKTLRNGSEQMKSVAGDYAKTLDALNAENDKWAKGQAKAAQEAARAMQAIRTAFEAGAATGKKAADNLLAAGKLSFDDYTNVVTDILTKIAAAGMGTDAIVGKSLDELQLGMRGADVSLQREFDSIYKSLLSAQAKNQKDTERQATEWRKAWHDAAKGVADDIDKAINGIVFGGKSLSSGIQSLVKGLGERLIKGQITKQSTKASDWLQDIFDPQKKKAAPAGSSAAAQSIMESVKPLLDANVSQQSAILSATQSAEQNAEAQASTAQAAALSASQVLDKLLGNATRLTVGATTLANMATTSFGSYVTTGTTSSVGGGVATTGSAIAGAVNSVHTALTNTKQLGASIASLASDVTTASRLNPKIAGKVGSVAGLAGDALSIKDGGMSAGNVTGVVSDIGKMSGGAFGSAVGAAMPYVGAVLAGVSLLTALTGQKKPDYLTKTAGTSYNTLMGTDFTGEVSSYSGADSMRGLLGGYQANADIASSQATPGHTFQTNVQMSPGAIPITVQGIDPSNASKVAEALAPHIDAIFSSQASLDAATHGDNN